MKKTIVLLIILLSSLHIQLGAQDDVFTISTSYNNLLSNPAGNGMLDRIMYAVFERLDIPCEIVFTGTERSLHDVNSGVLDAEMNRIAGMEEMYPNLVRVPEPNMVMEFVAFAREDYPIDSWESIRNLDIGIVKGWKILENNTEGFPFVTFVPTEVELFNMLRKDRIDVALYSRLTGYAVIKELAITGIRHLDPPLAKREMFLYVHTSKAYLAEDIAGALRALKADGTYDRIVREALAPYISGD